MGGGPFFWGEVHFFGGVHFCKGWDPFGTPQGPYRKDSEKLSFIDIGRLKVAQISGELNFCARIEFFLSPNLAKSAFFGEKKILFLFFLYAATAPS